MLVGGVINADEVGREGEEVGGIRGGQGLNFLLIPKLGPSLSAKVTFSDGGAVVLAS